MRRARLKICVATALCLVGAACGKSGAKAPLKVATAASLASAFESVAKAYTEKTGTKVSLVVSSSGKLTQQITEGAPYDLFASANASYLDQLASSKDIDPASQTVYALGRLVIWVKSGAAPPNLAALSAKPYEHIAIANPEHAPYGTAAREALEASGLWSALQGRLVRGSNVRQAMQYAESGNAEVGLIALSLALHGGGAYTLVDDSLHEPLLQSIAVVSSSGKKEAAQSFIAFLTSDAGRALLKPYGLEPTR